MANMKQKHYWTQLRAALTGGLWGSPAPAKAFNGSPISWSELFRKFNKHNHGYEEVTEIANQTQAVALLVAGGASEAELDGDSAAAAVVVSELALGEECVAAEERMDEVRSAYEAMRQLAEKSSKSDSVQLALAYFAYALGSYEECLGYLGKVRDLAEAQERLTPYASVRSNGSNLYAPSADTSSSSFIGSFTSFDSSISIADISEGNAWAATEVIRSVCLQGMSHEKLTPMDHQKALSIYLTAVLSLPTIEAEIARASPAGPAQVTAQGPGRLTFASFTRYRELWRWVERLLWRAIALASRTCPVGSDEESVLWALFAHYQSSSAHWPPTFRPEHRSTVLSLHIRALVLRSRLPGSPLLPSSVSFKSGLGSQDSSTGPGSWVATARRAIRDYRDVLNATTHFPKATERNFKVEELVDLTVATWEASGSLALHSGWVLDILWWATRLTFNSHRIFRHMTRVAEASGDAVLAARTLRLYVHVVSKAREAGEAENADTDGNWVSALVWGARMLCRLALAADTAKGERGIEEAREAGVMIEKAKTRADADDLEQRASIELAEGVWNTVMAVKEEDHLTRGSRLQAARTFFERSVQTYPTPSACYHLSLSLYRPLPERDLQRAILNARAAVEGQPAEIRYWHLLGLLLVASEDFQAARGVLEVGAAIEDEGWSDQALALANGAVPTNGHRPPNGDVQDESTPRASAAASTSETASLAGSSTVGQGSIVTAKPLPRHVVEEDATNLPPASSLLLPYPDHPPPSPSERFEHALQLRMTQLALTELMEGPEGAGEKWVEVFGWFAERKGLGRTPSQRTSLDTRRSAEVKPETAPNSPARPSMNGFSDMPPITLTPPTPGPEDEVHPQNGSAMGSGSFDEVREKEKDASAGKKVQKMLKSRVHKGQQRMSTISKKIGHGVGRRHNSLSLRRTSSVPVEYYAVQPYQASSIHSRRHSPIASMNELLGPELPPPLPPPQIPPREQGEHSKKGRRLLSDLWLMSAATFRRSGKLEQARGAIQEAEVQDEENPGVWVQLGLYHAAQNQPLRAIQAFNKALFIAPDHVPATVHLCQTYIAQADADADGVDLAAGMLADLTEGAGWDVAEAWYFLGRANGLRGVRARERECLCYALGLAEGRPLRDVGVALGWCL